MRFLFKPTHNFISSLLKVCAAVSFWGFPLNVETLLLELCYYFSQLFVLFLCMVKKINDIINDLLLSNHLDFSAGIFYISVSFIYFLKYILIIIYTYYNYFINTLIMNIIYVFNILNPYI